MFVMLFISSGHLPVAKVRLLMPRNHTVCQNMKGQVAPMVIVQSKHDKQKASLLKIFHNITARFLPAQVLSVCVKNI